jgi:antitoxin VapB
LREDDNRRAEVDRKIDRVTALTNELGVGGIVLAAQHNCAWLTAGRSNRVDATRETGSAALVVAADGRRFVLASTIESPRAMDEVTAGLGFELLEYPWTEDRADPSLPFRIAAKACGATELAADVHTGAARYAEPRIARARVTLVAEEIPRYCELGAEAGRVLGDVMGRLTPGSSEREVAATVSSAFLAIGAFPNVVLIAGDRRIASYRHPAPTAFRWRSRLLVVVSAERDGHVVALSRLLVVGRVDDDLRARTRATAFVFGRLLEATTPGTTGSLLFDAAARAYAEAGHPGEERLHHQGGTIAFRSREWVAHPSSTEVVAPPQMFAWNPTIAGTKVEDTCLLDEDGRFTLITPTPGWPTIELDVRGQKIAAADVLVMSR